MALTISSAIGNGFPRRSRLGSQRYGRFLRAAVAGSGGAGYERPSERRCRSVQVLRPPARMSSLPRPPNTAPIGQIAGLFLRPATPREAARAPAGEPQLPTGARKAVR